MKYLVVLLLGLAIGLWFGVNIGKGNALYDNPFAEKSLLDDVLDSADDQGLLDKGEDLMEETKEALKEKAKKAMDKL